MKRNFTFFLLAILAAATAPVFAQTNSVQKVDLGTFSKYTVPIVIAGDAQLAELAHKAFQAHGRYQRVTTGGEYTLTFTSVSPTQVRVEIAGKTSVTTATANGANTRDAFFRAADAAVKATGGGNGFFTAKLAFVSNVTGGKDEIYTSDVLLLEARQVTNQHATILMPRWSPDGGRLLYTSFANSNSADIFQLELASGRATTYASYNGTNMSGRYSPDGSRVVMVISPAGGSPNLYVGTPDGRSKPTRITTTPEAKSSPCFSPDGQRIVFAMEYGPQLYTMSVSGGTPTRLSTGASYSAEPDWSRANPNLIVFTTKVGGVFRLGVYDFSTGKTRFIEPKDAGGAKIGGDFIEPAWLPDGRHVVCTWRTAGQRALYIVDTEEKSLNRGTKISARRAEHADVWAQR